MRAVDADLTAAARIRASAMRLFGERGVAGTSIRQIAAGAGVSSSLVVHHFGTKDGVKRAVDVRVLEVMTGLLEGLGAELDEPGSATQALSVALQGEPDLLAYLRRLLVDGDASGRVVFSGLVEATDAQLRSLEAAGLVRPVEDRRGRAVFLMVNDLATILLRDLIADAVGYDPLSQDGMPRWAAIGMDTYLNGIFASPPEQEGGR